MFCIIIKIRNNLIKLYLKYKNVDKHESTKVSKGLILISYLNFLEFIFPSMKIKNDEQNLSTYWKIKTIPDLISAADKLYSEGKFLEVYEILNRMQFNDNVDIRWRICRVLYKMSNSENTPRDVRENMIMEAYILISKTLDLSHNNAEASQVPLFNDTYVQIVPYFLVHKWMAIILDAKAAFEGTIQRVRAAPKVKEHMMKSTELNPNDALVYHMLGFWCYSMTKLTWFQRNIAKVLLCSPPESSYTEAYNYFMKVEELQPRKFAENIYMLGKCCYEMGMYYRARYYLLLASNLPVLNEINRKQAEEARALAESLKEYDVAEHVLNLD